jgi:hypothetical protein
MNKATIAALILAVICMVSAVAQDQGQERHDQQAQQRSAHRTRKTNMTGYVRKDGDNYVLENDKDQQRYRIQNTDAVRTHEGHHVSINGRMHDDDRSLEVNKVKMVRERQKHDHQ